MDIVARALAMGSGGGGSSEIAALSERIAALENPFTRFYRPVEAIEGDGTQYIDTGYVFKENTRIVCDCMLFSSTKSFEWICGSRNGNGSQNSSFQLFKRYDSVNKLIFFRNTASTYENEKDLFPNELTLNTRCTITASGSTVQVDSHDGNPQTYDGETTPSDGLNTMFLFGCNSARTAVGKTLCENSCALMRLYGFRIYEGETLVHDLTPAVSLYDGTVCLYDKLTRKALTNAGTGNFIAVE